jgi:hypothetical protein
LFKVRNGLITIVGLSNDEQEHLSFQTLKNSLNFYYKRVCEPKRYRKHELIKRVHGEGNLQFDVKIIGALDNKFHQQIYCIDCVDERSGMVYGKASLSQPKDSLIKVFSYAHAYFSQYFKVVRVRTDHAMTFKKTESLNTGEFNQLLTSLNVLHQYSL